MLQVTFDWGNVAFTILPHAREKKIFQIAFNAKFEEQTKHRVIQSIEEEP
jgi:hypothetical protein